MAQVLPSLAAALEMAFGMFWQIFWGLSLGFLTSSIIEVAISKAEMSRLLPDDSARTLTIATALGAVSSSCSYAAVAMARSIVRRGGNFTAAMVFQLAATNLVVEIGLLLWVLLGWQFAAAEFIGGPIMIVCMTCLFRLFLHHPLEEQAIVQAKKGLLGSMEGHAAMSMEQRTGTWVQRLGSRSGWVEISHAYVMNWQMLWKDISIGILVAGALSAWVPIDLWHQLFLSGSPEFSIIWGALIGPLIAVASFTCSVGNVTLAAVLWAGGLSFGGVAAFMFGDLVILPILNIYRKYYGRKMTLFILVTFYTSMIIAALLVDGIFRSQSWIPDQHRVVTTEATISWNYSTYLNISFGLVAVALVYVFLRTGGLEMLRMMASEAPHSHPNHSSDLHRDCHHLHLPPTEQQSTPEDARHTVGKPIKCSSDGRS
jgi:uncharacterized protein